MGANLEELVISENESFFIGIFQDNFDKNNWHYHNNYEISFITEGTGRRIVGDSIANFYPGDLVFIGPRLPHVWIPDKESWSLSNRSLEMVILQFNSNALCNQILSLPEFKLVYNALNYSERGIQIIGQTLNEASEIMLQLPFQDNFNKIINLFILLNIIGKSDNNIYLASEEYFRKRFNTGSKRISMIHEFLMNNYLKDIKLQQIADIVHMTQGALCHFFKMNMGITIFKYLNQIKVDFACKLLMDPDLSIIQVGLGSGFNNVSHFNKQFKIITGLSPSEYRKRFIKVI
jgi:AraC-like DNA-binding protein